MAPSLVKVFIFAAVIHVGVYSETVLTMNGDVSAYMQAGESYSVSNGGILFDQQHFSRTIQECVKRVIVRIKGIEAEQVKVPCAYNIVGSGGHYQCENAFTVEPEAGTGNFRAMYNLGDGSCIQRVYSMQGNPQRIVKLVDRIVKDEDCNNLANNKNMFEHLFKNNFGGMDFTNGNVVIGSNNVHNDIDEHNEIEEDEHDWIVSEEEGESGVEEFEDEFEDEDFEDEFEDEDFEGDEEDNETQKPSNSPLPPKKQNEFDKEKVLIMDGDISGYTQGGTKDSYSIGGIQMENQEFFKGSGGCIRRIIIGINGVEAERVKVQCSNNLRGVNGNYQCGNAFYLMPMPGTNLLFKALYNLGDGNCIRRIYSTQGHPKRIHKMVDRTVNDEECKKLAEGKDMLPDRFVDGKGGNGVPVNNDKIQIQGVTGGTFRPVNNDKIQIQGVTGGTFHLGNHDTGNIQMQGVTGGTFHYDAEDDIADEEYEVEEDEEGGLVEEEEEGVVEDEGEIEDEFEDDEENSVVDVHKPDTTGEPASPADEYLTLEKQKVAVLSGNVVGYQTEGTQHSVEGRGFVFTTQKYVKPGTDECFKLVTVRKLGEKEILEFVKISCEYVEPDKKRGFNLHFDGVIYESPPFDVTYVVRDGVCKTRQYFMNKKTDTVLSVDECDKLTRRSLDQRLSGAVPGPEPISAADIAVMEKQMVAILDGSLKDYKPKGSVTKYTTQNYGVEVQHFEKAKQCVKVVSIKRNDHDQYFEQVKLPCKIMGPVVTNDEDIELNYGNVIYIRDRLSSVFITKDGACVQRSYNIMWDEVQKNEHTLNQPDCYQLTRWRQQERSSMAKLNKQPPPKTDQAPGDMWLLDFNGVTSGLKEGPSTFSMGELRTQDFYKGAEQCIRVVIINIEGLEADRLKVSCGPIKGISMNRSNTVYGKAFLIKANQGTNTYKALFNIREKSCMKRIYTIGPGSKTISKSLLTKSDEQDCKDLVGGKIKLNGGSMFGGATIFN